VSALVDTVDRRIPRVRTSTVLKVARELAFVVAFYWLYEWIRGLVVQSGSVAVHHANQLIDLEQRLGLLWERDLQSVFIGMRPLIRGFNLYYGGTHFLVPIATLLWVALRHPGDYPRVRNLLAVTTAIGFAIFSVLPMAPPRLMHDRLDIVDTIRHLDGGQVATQLMDRAGNAYAAMPSLHIAWAVWTTLALYPLLRTRWAKALAVAYPILTSLVVVVTGNHYVLDCVAGVALIYFAQWVIKLWTAGMDRARRRDRSEAAAPG
jgi:PAP2 superfamily